MPKKNTKNAKASKKKSLKNIQQSHGKAESKPVPTTLDQIWGDDGVWKYSTLDEGEYRNYVKTLTWTDLRSHASHHGLVPVGDRAELEIKLINEFRQHASGYNVKTTSSNSSQQSIPPEIKKILEEKKDVNNYGKRIKRR